MADIREHVHQLVDRLPEAQIAGLIHFLETIVDPALAAIHTAAPEDEEIGCDEDQAVREARIWLSENAAKAYRTRKPCAVLASETWKSSGPGVLSKICRAGQRESASRENGGRALCE